MSRFMSDPWIEGRVRAAIAHFWRKRADQAERAGPDQGNRRAATGGAQLQKFAALVAEIAVRSGFKPADVFLSADREIPGYFRPSKEWDVLVVRNGRLVAAVELKSHIGPSFGNNFNNRAEEALGNAVDLWTAYREGVFGVQAQPWLGYAMLLEDHEKAKTPVASRSAHFDVLPAFARASYLTRYEELCRRLVLEKHYSATALVVAPKARPGSYAEPLPEVGIRRFLRALRAHLLAHRVR